jgi:4-hydroxy-tetrahydrodipicolinate synthase
MLANGWRGVFPAVTTQFKRDESVDVPATLGHLDVLLKSGVHGLVMLGTLGENCSLTHAEKAELLRAVCGHVKGRVPVLTGVAETTTAGACSYAGDAKRAGVDGLMVLPAMVYPSDTRETVHHISAVAGAAKLPVMVYNNPVSYKVDLKPEDFEAFLGNEYCVAIKESSDDPRRVTDIRRLHGERFALFCGVDDLVVESYAAGIDGWVAGLVNAFPAENAALWGMLERGAWKEARELYRWFAPLLHLDTHAKLVQYIKLAMQEERLGTERCRAPRLELAGEERERVLGVIRAAVKIRPRLGA